MATGDREHWWAVVLAGGEGRRLGDLSRRISGDSRPKQFCVFFGGRSLLSHTRERIAPLFHEEQTLFVLSQAHQVYYNEDLREVPGTRRIVQTANRGTAVAMALCTQEILRRDDQAVVAFFPSDHFCSDGSAFQATIQCGLEMIEDHRHDLMILGAAPRSPEVEYGWIQPGGMVEQSRGNSLSRVAGFWEKPGLTDAIALQQRGCLWNTFVTMGLAATFAEIFNETIPNLLTPSDLSAADFSRDVLSRAAHRLLVLRDVASGWTDLGSPRRLADVLEAMSAGSAGLAASHAAGQTRQTSVAAGLERC